MSSPTVIHSGSETVSRLSEAAQPLSTPAARGLNVSSALNATILAVAVLFGGWLRFRGLGALDMTADEGSSWMPASAPSLGQVLHLGLKLNIGRLAAHDLTLHFWMLAFGDSVASIRALSALLGTIAIVLVFALARELFANREDTVVPMFATDSDSIASLSALVFALNVVAIRYSQEGRMYALMLDATLIQLWFFIRAVRRGGFANYAGTALFTVLAMATSFVAGLAFVAESLCLLYALRPGVSLWPYSRSVAVTLIFSGAIVAGLTPWHLWIGEVNFISWIRPGFLTLYIGSFFRAAIESPVLIVTLALAAWGLIRGWSRYAEGISLAVVWMLVPLLAVAAWLGPVMLEVVTIYSWTPLFADRWVLTCIVPMCIFAGLGIWELRPSQARIGVLILLVVLAALRIHSYDPDSGDVEWGVQWQAATEAALPELKAGRPVTVVPGYGMYVVQYYSGKEHVNPALVLPEGSRRAQVLILADTAQSLLPKDIPALHRRYFLERARLRGVSVLSTPFALSPPSIFPPAN
jgi:Dolichyl-phosphate-mannose-protein mannosyltransferase